MSININLAEAGISVSKVLSIVYDGMMSGDLSRQNALYISNSVDQFTALSILVLKYVKATGRDLDLRPLPDLVPLIDYLNENRQSEAIAEAKNIRKEIAPIIEQAKAAGRR